ncbi:GIY-YIG nuclease family protein [Streptosporangium pseudovulgare]|uniref:Uncharacterized protein n=1 Tax=Streptosporangium pseudovulgare TaxID=35765 RepID=A0ABQ2QMC9_9ACTN|nr:GIY-YIG nuclease family protein [Streptosporangium pseudovulgare]GGP84354.1 hypothetical protein GCM10010140_11780 [Streptosporangium pseudovulgare]
MAVLQRHVFDGAYGRGGRPRWNAGSTRPRTYALIFSDDAVGLEGRLHAALNDRRVDKVNLRREFFRPTPAEVRNLLEQIAGRHLLEYRDVPEALEWRQSIHATAAVGEGEARV